MTRKGQRHGKRASAGKLRDKLSSSAHCMGASGYLFNSICRHACQQHKSPPVIGVWAAWRGTLVHLQAPRHLCLPLPHGLLQQSQLCGAQRIGLVLPIGQSLVKLLHQRGGRAVGHGPQAGQHVVRTTFVGKPGLAVQAATFCIHPRWHSGVAGTQGQQVQAVKAKPITRQCRQRHPFTAAQLQP